MLTGVPGRRLSTDYLAGAIGDRSVWRSDTAPARVSDSPCRHTEAAAGGAGSVRGRLGSGAGVRGSEVWLGVEVGAAGPIAETVVKPAGSKQRGALLRTFLHPADPQDSVQDKQELLWGSISWLWRGDWCSYISRCEWQDQLG